jgi:hypothetical protein
VHVHVHVRVRVRRPTDVGVLHSPGTLRGA